MNTYEKDKNTKRRARIVRRYGRRNELDQDYHNWSVDTRILFKLTYGYDPIDIDNDPFDGYARRWAYNRH